MWEDSGRERRQTSQRPGPEGKQFGKLPTFLFCLLYPSLRPEGASNPETPMGAHTYTHVYTHTHTPKAFCPKPEDMERAA